MTLTNSKEPSLAANHTFDNVNIGMSASFKKNITENDLSLFSEITGDMNPLHMDDVFAKTSKFKQRVAHGLLSQSLISTLAGMHLPGVHSLILDLHSQFKKPVFIGDTLTVVGTVTKKQDVGKLLFMDVVITNQAGVVVISSKLIIGVQA